MQNNEQSPLPPPVEMGDSSDQMFTVDADIGQEGVPGGDNSSGNTLHNKNIYSPSKYLFTTVCMK